MNDDIPVDNINGLEEVGGVCVQADDGRVSVVSVAGALPTRRKRRDRSYGRPGKLTASDSVPTTKAQRAAMSEILHQNGIKPPYILNGEPNEVVPGVFVGIKRGTGRLVNLDGSFAD